jgi:fluoride exporter
VSQLGCPTVLAVPAVLLVSAGGALGALARYGVTLALPTAPGGFPWATFWVNVTGCLLIGALVAYVGERPLPRLFLGTGVLGGYTTFSAYAVEVDGLAHSSMPLAAGYAAGTLIAALAAYAAGRAVAGRRR